MRDWRAGLHTTVFVCTVAAGALGCTGVIGGGDQSDPSGANGGIGGPGTLSANQPGVVAGAAATVGESPLRRLGKVELHNTLLDLFPKLPATFDADIDLPADNSVQLGFSVPGTVSDLEVKRFMDLAEATVAKVGMDALAPCTGTDQSACARSFVTSFGKRAFRRPLDGSEVDDLVALYTKLRTDPDMKYGYPEALGIVVQAILQSPGFLYRWERGLAAPQMDGSLVKFDDYEMASRLSYFVYNSMPDAELFAQADAGKLSTPDEIALEAARLLADPRADATLADFVEQWLELGTLQGLIKDASAYPNFKPELRDSMHAETVAFTHDVLRGPSPTFTGLLTAPYTFVDAKLGQYYGLVPGAGGRVDLTGSPRLGVLTEGAVMAVKGNSYRTSPVRRGKFVLNRLLCETVPPPPPNVVPELPPPDPTKTLREQMAQHRSVASCAVCHTSMDALGFAFEHFDGAGNFRATDGTHPIDASGSIKLEDGTTIAFQEASGLAKGLAGSPVAQQCFVRQWLRYAIDRFEQDADAAAVTFLSNAYKASGLDTRDLIVQVTKTLPFSHRALAQGEVISP